jgi:acyl-[acyl carrier protein]--UDP-N-acetylglucosamine O-acyltransferase
MNGGSRTGGGITKVGNNGYFMAYSHIGHDCCRRCCDRRFSRSSATLPVIG